jgi:acetylglutamate kinase
VTRLVVKMGGHALDDLSASSVALRALAEDVVTLRREGAEIALVHGGGPQIAELLARVGLASEFNEGLRVTSTETMQYVAMALARVNVSLVATLSRHGLACVGLMGADGGLIRAESLGAPWDRAGTVARVDCDVLEAQWNGGFVPVIGSVALDDEGGLLNCNADVVAGAIAGALGATTLVLLSDIDQLRADPDDAASALSHVSASHVHEMIASGAARDGMRPKMTAAVDALSAGAQRVLLANGTRPHALRDVVHNKIPTTEVLA